MAHVSIPLSRRGQVEPFHVMELLKAANQRAGTHGDVAVTTGSSAAFTAIFLAAFDAGDTVLMTRPGYPAYRNSLLALGCKAVELDCGPQERFQPTVDQLRSWSQENGGPPRGLIIASPANPTGTVIAPDELARVARWCDEQDVLLISDEIYHGITYGPRKHPATPFWSAR